MKSRKVGLMAVSLSTVVIFLLIAENGRGLGDISSLTATSSSPITVSSPTPDPALRMSGMAEFMAKYPSDWESRLASGIRPMIEFQRMIGEHGTVVSFADNQPGPSNPNPQVRVFIANWDGVDLFARGVVRTYNGKPVELVTTGGETKPAK